MNPIGSTTPSDLVWKNSDALIVEYEESLIWLSDLFRIEAGSNLLTYLRLLREGVAEVHRYGLGNALRDASYRSAFYEANQIVHLHRAMQTVEQEVHIPPKTLDKLKQGRFL